MAARCRPPDVRGCVWPVFDRYLASVWPAFDKCCLTWRCFEQLGLDRVLGVSPATAQSFILSARAGMPANAYHNWTHVADVTQAGFWLHRCYCCRSIFEHTYRSVSSTLKGHLFGPFTPKFPFGPFPPYVCPYA
jgi:hypothetical protein